MPSLKKKSTRQNKSIKILNIINTKIDMVQETLNKMVNKEEDVESGDFSNTAVATPTSETIASYQSDMNSGEEAGMAGEEPVSSLTDNASYGTSDEIVTPEGQAEGTGPAAANENSDLTSDEMISSDNAASTVANKGSDTGAQSPVSPMATEGASEATTVEGEKEAPSEISNETTVATSDSGSPEQYAQNPNATPESLEVGELNEKLKEHEEMVREPEKKTGGKKRTKKRNHRRNMKSRRRQSRR